MKINKSGISSILLMKLKSNDIDPIIFSALSGTSGGAILGSSFGFSGAVIGAITATILLG